MFPIGPLESPVASHDESPPAEQVSQGTSKPATSCAQRHSIDEILSTSWERKIAHDLTAELEAYTGERRVSTEEMRKFLAVKAFRELLERVAAARGSLPPTAALKAVAHAMRSYALERPALAASAFRTPATDCPQWHAAHTRLCDFMVGLLAECGLDRNSAETALCTLRCLVRGFVMHEVMDSFLLTYPYAEAFDAAMEIFIAGIAAAAPCESRATETSAQISWGTSQKLSSPGEAGLGTKKE